MVLLVATGSEVMHAESAQLVPFSPQTGVIKHDIPSALGFGLAQALAPLSVAFAGRRPESDLALWSTQRGSTPSRT